MITYIQWCGAPHPIQIYRGLGERQHSINDEDIPLLFRQKGYALREIREGSGGHGGGKFGVLDAESFQSSCSMVLSGGNSFSYYSISSRCER